MYTSYVSGIVFALETVFGVLSNLFTLYILQFGTRTGEWLDDKKSVHIINLAITNIISALTLPTAEFLTVNLIVHCIEYATISFRVLRETLQYTVLALNIAVCFEILVVLYFPFIFYKYQTRHKVIVTVCAWILAFLISMCIALYPAHDSRLPNLCERVSLNYSSNSSTNNSQRDTEKITSAVQQGKDLYTLITLVVLLGIITICYTVIGLKLSIQAKKLRGGASIFTDPTLQVWLIQEHRIKSFL